MTIYRVIVFVVNGFSGGGEEKGRAKVSELGEL